MSIPEDVGRAITNWLNAETFSLPFTAVYKYIPEYEYDDIATTGDLYCSVVPRDWDMEQLTRDKLQYDVNIDIGFIQKIPDDDVSLHIDVAEEVSKGLQTDGNRAMGPGRFISVSSQNIYDVENLRRARMALVVVTGTYRAWL